MRLALMAAMLVDRQCQRRVARAAAFAAYAVSFTNFVGRDQEVALLTDRWHQAVQGEGQILVLLGEAGIGKSRIVETFRQLVSDESHITLRYQCSPYHIDSSLHPIIRQLEHAAALAADDSPLVKLDKLETLLRRRRLRETLGMLGAAARRGVRRATMSAPRRRSSIERGGSGNRMEERAAGTPLVSIAARRIIWQIKSWNCSLCADGSRRQGPPP
jgi:predicted Ser/Thr protein kinase